MLGFRKVRGLSAERNDYLSDLLHTSYGCRDSQRLRAAINLLACFDWLLWRCERFTPRRRLDWEEKRLQELGSGSSELALLRSLLSHMAALIVGSYSRSQRFSGSCTCSAVRFTMMGDARVFRFFSCVFYLQRRAFWIPNFFSLVLWSISDCHPCWLCKADGKHQSPPPWARWPGLKLITYSNISYGRAEDLLWSPSLVERLPAHRNHTRASM